MPHYLDTPLARQNGPCTSMTCTSSPGEASTALVMDVNPGITGVYAQPGFHPAMTQ